MVAFAPYAADPPAVQWIKTFTGDGEAWGCYVEQTTDGGYFVAGTTIVEPDEKVLLVKTNSSGEATWTKTLSGSGHLRAYSAQQTADGGYIVGANGPEAGMTRWDVHLMKMDGQGNLVWQGDVSGADFPEDASGHSVVQTSDGGYAVVGTTTLSDHAVILFRTDNLGRRVWFKRYAIYIGEGTYDRVSLRQTSDGGYVIGTRTLLKVDAQGNQQWLKTFDDVDCAASVLQMPDGGYVATGPQQGYGFIYLLKTNASGSQEWFAGNLVAGPTSGGRWVERTAAGDFVVAGNYRVPENETKANVLRTTSSGTLVWNYPLFDGSAECVRQTQDGGYIVTGQCRAPNGTSSMFLTKLAPEQKGKVR